MFLKRKTPGRVILSNRFHLSVFRTERHLGEWTFGLSDFRVKPSAQSGISVGEHHEILTQRAWSQCRIQILKSFQKFLRGMS
jgi:hypothetical protein